MDNANSAKVLGLQYRPVGPGINEMIYSMLDAGLLVDRRKQPQAGGMTKQLLGAALLVGAIAAFITLKQKEAN